MRVDYYGDVECAGRFVSYNDNGVCPALNLNLSSSDLWSYAGTVCSDEMRSSKPDNSNNGNNGNNNNGGNGNSGSNQVIEAGGNLILGEEKSAQVTGGAGKFFPGGLFFENYDVSGRNRKGNRSQGWKLYDQGNRRNWKK